MKKLFFCLLILSASIAKAQFSLRLVITDVATKKQDDIYVAGNFNNWNPKDDNYKLKPFAGGRKSIVIKDLAGGSYAFKFTRGDFSKVECMADGRDIADRTIEVTADASQELTIAGWKDDYPDKPKPYTASPQVRIVDTAFKISQLNRTRRIWVYLPKGYTTASKKYPVLYMHDGQNLFNEQLAPFGEWGVDEALDTLQQKLGKECIIIGIDNSKDRMTEYNPYDTEKYGAGEGKKYADFIATVLKPFIDSKYRTLKGPENTSIAGSSMGGLISLYAVMQYPNVFGAAGVFSPSLWISPAIFDDAAKYTPDMPAKIYLYMGGREGVNMVADFEKMNTVLSQKKNINLRKSLYPLGGHNEKSWRDEFDDFYRWLMN